MIFKYTLEHVYARREVNSDRFEISNHFEMLFHLHGNLHGDFIGHMPLDNVLIGPTTDNRGKGFHHETG